MKIKLINFQAAHFVKLLFFLSISELKSLYLPDVILLQFSSYTPGMREIFQ
jgi:hypothetical protein